MTRIVFGNRAIADIERLTDFLVTSLPADAADTAGVIVDGLSVLVRHPEIGRPAQEGLRELVISRGRTGYVALYDYDEQNDSVLIWAIRHQRESGYKH